MATPSEDQSARLTHLVLLCITLLLTACSDSEQATASNARIEKQVASEHVPISAPLFIERAQETGLHFEHYGGATQEYFLIESMGSGGAFFDYDNDGDLDVYLVQSNKINGKSTLLLPFPSFTLENKLFENRLIPDGKVAFVDVTENAGVGDDGYGMGVAVADFDNDGFQDMIVTNLGTSTLYLNQGDGSFKQGNIVSDKSREVFGTSAGVLDYNNDGNLDVYVAQYAYLDREDSIECIGRSSTRDYCTPDLYSATPDLLYAGDGNGTLTLVEQWRASNVTPKPGLGVVAADYNNDGLIDLYVANDGKPNLLWLNQGAGKFNESAVMNGAALNANGKEEASMGVTSADVDGDGDEDIFMTHLKGETNTLYTNLGNAIFIDSTINFRLSNDSLPSTGFGTRWFDMDNDGDLDIFVANGGVMKESSQIGKFDYPYYQFNQLFENQGNSRFADISKSAGLHKMPMTISRGAAFGDVDNDGDVDVLVTNNHGPVELLINQSLKSSSWLTVRLQARLNNRDAIGARIGVERADGTLVWRRVGTDGSYLSASDLRTHFGLGTDTGIKGIRVVWPGGQQEHFVITALNQHLTLKQGEGILVK